MIHPAHRRLAEIYARAEQVGYDNLTELEQQDLIHCMQLNAKYVREVSLLEHLSEIVYRSGDVDYQHEICGRLEAIKYA